jgi:hypothetical protein
MISEMPLMNDFIPARKTSFADKNAPSQWVAQSAKHVKH